MQKSLRYLLALAATFIISFNIYASNSPDTLKDDPIDPIRVLAIFHDDVPVAKRNTVHNEYILPFTKEFENITGRKIGVILDDSKSLYSNFNYKGDDLKKTMSDWKALAWQYRKEKNDKKELRASRNDRVLLITNEMMNGNQLLGGIAGAADAQPGRTAISSLEIRQAIGHELGHTFNADHEEGEVLYNGWWCETFMFPPLFLRSNCLVFSEGNRKRIKAYVDGLY